MKLTSLSVLFLLLITGACEPQTKTEEPEQIAEPAPLSPIRVERFSENSAGVIPEGAEIEVLDSGMIWSEGPLWLAAQNKLIFSDVPQNTIYEWTEAGGKKVYLTPSGTDSTVSRNEGSNGLLLDGEGRLILCQHGDRRMARMKAPLDAPAPVYETLAAKFEGKRLNSPNDAVYSADFARLYFTDPPYGLAGQDEDPAKEQGKNGLYLLENKKLTLLYDSLSRPNGVALSPDGKKLYAANSDKNRAVIMVFPVAENGTTGAPELLVDLTEMCKTEAGLPDGMKTDKAGNLYATGPGGVHVFSPSGERLALIRTGQATANVALDTDEKYLYMTADDYLMRIKLK